MKTFKEFIQEAGLGNGANLPWLEDFVAEHCKDFLKTLHAAADDVVHGGRYKLFRGVDLDNSKRVTFKDTDHKVDRIVGHIKTVRKDREPLDTNYDVSIILDDIFEKKFGWRPRSQSMFCLAKINHADDLAHYGTVCRVYPMGPIRFVYSPKIIDLTESVQNFLFDNNMHRNSYSEEELVETKELLEDFIDKADYRSENLEAAMRTRSEIMIDCGKYLATKERDQGTGGK